MEEENIKFNEDDSNLSSHSLDSEELNVKEDFDTEYAKKFGEDIPLKNTLNDPKKGNQDEFLDLS